MPRIGAHLSLVLVFVAACSVRPHTSVQVPVGTLALYSSGTGSPTIVLESSVGDDASTWNPVFDSLSAITRTVAYDRAGYGRSRFRDPSAIGLTSGADVAKSLRAGLSELGASPPFILVGHSIGGLYVLDFARLFPNEVAGLVLIDARMASFPEACEAAAVPPCNPPASLIASVPSHVRAELLGLSLAESQALSPDGAGPLPITLIASEHAGDDRFEGGHRVLVREQRRYASELSNGRFLVAEGSGHYVHRHRTDIVIAEVRRLVMAVRGASSGTIS